MKKILGILAALALVLTALPAFATSYPVGGVQYYLSGAGVNSSQTTIQLTSFKTADGRNITMTNFGTIGYGALEPQTNAKLEDITFTGIVQNSNGTATLTGVTRGLDFLYPYATSASLAHSHSGGSTLIITNTAGFYYNEFAMPPLSNDNVWPTASTSVSTKGYTDYVAFNGAAVINANTTNKGVVEIATQLEAASSTAIGGTGATVVIPASSATSTYNAATAPLRVIVTDNTGHIDSNFIGALATTTNIGYQGAYNIGKNEQFITTTGTSTFAVPAGITKLAVTVQGAGATGGSCYSTSGNGIATGGGAAGGNAFGFIDVTGTTTIQVFVGATTTSTTTAAQWSTFGTNGFYSYATGGNPGNSGSGGQGSTVGGTGGLGHAPTSGINITGQAGSQGVFYNSTGAVVIFGGNGGSSPLGFGGPYESGTSYGATGYGAGGPGAICPSGNTLNLGGPATQGAVDIRW